MYNTKQVPNAGSQANPPSGFGDLGPSGRRLFRRRQLRRVRRVLWHVRRLALTWVGPQKPLEMLALSRCLSAELLRRTLLSPLCVLCRNPVFLTAVQGTLQSMRNALFGENFWKEFTQTAWTFDKKTKSEIFASQVRYTSCRDESLLPWIPSDRIYPPLRANPQGACTFPKTLAHRVRSKY